MIVATGCPVRRISLGPVGGTPSGVPPYVLLRKLERDGLIARRILDLAPIGVEYAGTELGHTLKAPFEALHAWVGLYFAEVEAARSRFDRRAERGRAEGGRAGC